MVGKRIEKLRNERGETQEQLAKAIGVSREIINHWENGTRHIKEQHIAVLVEHFDVYADYLLGLSDTPSRGAQLQAVCDYTGLSEQAIFTLVVAKENGLSALFDKAIENTKDMICEIKGGA